MKTIRIGNDIRLKITLDGIENYQNTSIKQVKCYVSRVEDKPTNNISCGFPQYISDEYNLNTCGFPIYRTHPFNCSCYKYDGFGIFPKSRSNKYRKFDYLMPSKILQEKSVIECYFPASEQRYCGIYKLIVVISMYQSGWGSTNIRTYTVDYGNIFELVDDETGESGNLTITVSNYDKNDVCSVQYRYSFTATFGPTEEVEKYHEHTLKNNIFAPPNHKEFLYWRVIGENYDEIKYPGDKIEVTSDLIIVPVWTDNLRETVEKLDEEMEKLRLPENEEFVKIIDN